MKKHRGQRAYRMTLKEFLPGEVNPGCIVTCGRWFATTQKEARETFIKTALPMSEGRLVCSAIARKKV